MPCFTFLSTICYAHCLLEYSKYIIVPRFEVPTEVIIIVVRPLLQLIIHVCFPVLNIEKVQYLLWCEVTVEWQNLTLFEV